MSYEIYRYIFIGGAALAAVMLLGSVLIFFVLNIPRVIGDLTGATARKAIADIRSKNENTGDRLQRPTAHQRGEITDRISRSGRIVKKQEFSMDGLVHTEELNTEQGNHQAAMETTVLSETLAPETTVLSPVEGNNETTVLNAVPFPDEFVIEYEITYIHSGEVIA